jgi:PII-like signaling protein
MSAREPTEPKSGALDNAGRGNDKPLSVARIYLRKRSRHRGSGLLGRLFPSSLARYLAGEALRDGLLLASVTLGHMGFAPGGRRIDEDNSESQPETLPTCVEIVGDRTSIDIFVAAHATDLADATVVVFDGTQISVAALLDRVVG